jgi:nucleoredoxin
MAKYMRDMEMPWPAVEFEKIKDKPALLQFAGSGIPCLVVIDRDGRVVSDSYDGSRYLGPAKVMADLERMLSGTTAPVAQR